MAPTDNEKTGEDNINKWRGYVVRALEDICKEMSETKQILEKMDEKIDVKIEKLAEKVDDKILGSNKATDEKFNNINKVLSSHKSKIAVLMVKSGVWGALGGILTVLGTIIVALVIHFATKSPSVTP